MCKHRNLTSDNKILRTRGETAPQEQFSAFSQYIQHITCSQNRQSTKFQNHENINFVEKLYFFILYNQIYIAKHDVKSLHSGFIFRENTSHYKVEGYM